MMKLLNKKTIHLWLHALCDRAVWRRATLLAISVGGVQVAINQGDLWLQHKVTPAVWFKTIATPVITMAVSLFSGVASHVQKAVEKLP